MSQPGSLHHSHLTHTHIQSTSFGVYHLLWNTTFQCPEVWLCLFFLVKSWDIADKLLPVLVFLLRVQHSSSTSTTSLLGKRARWLAVLPGGWNITEWWSEHWEEELLPFVLSWTSTQSHVGEEKKCSIRVKREIRTQFYTPHGIAMPTFKQWNENFT